jgi:hypothetical protein
MNLTYKLHPNNFTNGSNRFKAIVQSQGTATHEDVLNHMRALGSNVNQADSNAVIQNYFSSVWACLLDGRTVNTPFLNYKATIRGNFVDETDSFDPDRHQIEVSISPGVQCRRAMRQAQAQMQKQETIELLPGLLAFYDVNSGQRNSTVTPGGLGRLTGRRLKFEAEDPNQGIFFVAADEQTGLPLADPNGAYRVEVVGRNTPGELMFIVPGGLPAGSYRLEVRNLTAAGELHTGVLKNRLAVG